MDDTMGSSSQAAFRGSNAKMMRRDARRTICDMPMWASIGVNRSVDCGRAAQAIAGPAIETVALPFPRSDWRD